MTLTFPPGTPNWVDLGTTDVTGATAFYGALFGWVVQDLGAEAGGYGFIRLGDKQVGGIGPATDPDRGTSWAVYFCVADAAATATAVQANGGKVIVPATDVMGQGRMAVFTDPSGAYFSVWQPGAHGGFEVNGPTGSVGWVELATPDIAAARAFYPAVLPVRTRDVQMGEGPGYTLLRVGDRDVAGAMQVGAEAGPPHWAVYFTVEDCDATADQAIELGATELVRQDSPAGRFAVLVDPQGGSFAVIKPDPTFSI